MERKKAVMHLGVAMLIIFSILLPSPWGRASLRILRVDFDMDAYRLIAPEHYAADQYIFAYLPYDYEITAVESRFSSTYAAISAQGRYVIRFSAHPMAGTRMSVDNENISVEVGYINGTLALLYTARTPESSNIVVWVIDDMLLSLTSQLALEDLIDIAQYCSKIS